MKLFGSGPAVREARRVLMVDILWALAWVAALVAMALCSGRGSKFIYIDF